MYADNLRVPYELHPGELSAHVRLIQAVAAIQDRKPPPEPSRQRAGSA